MACSRLTTYSIFLLSKETTEESVEHLSSSSARRQRRRHGREIRKDAIRAFLFLFWVFFEIAVITSTFCPIWKGWSHRRLGNVVIPSMRMLQMGHINSRSSPSPLPPLYIGSGGAESAISFFVVIIHVPFPSTTCSAGPDDALSLTPASRPILSR